MMSANDKDSSGRAINRAGYNAIAAEWDRERRLFHGSEGRYMDALLGGLAVPSNILDLGCGTGRPIAEYLLARGHHVTGVDQAEAMLELARSRHPGGTWIESTIETFSTPNRFDAIVCWDALFHIERTHHEPLLTRFASMLHIGGRLALTIGGSDHPAFTDTMFGETFFYDSLTPDKVLSILDRLGFTPLVSEFTDLPTGGRDKGRYAIVAQLTDRSTSPEFQAEE